jgi:hypothetical protein
MVRGERNYNGQKQSHASVAAALECCRAHSCSSLYMLQHMPGLLGLSSFPAGKKKNKRGVENKNSIFQVELFAKIDKNIKGLRSRTSCKDMILIVMIV